MECARAGNHNRGEHPPLPLKLKYQHFITVGPSFLYTAGHLYAPPCFDFDSKILGQFWVTRYKMAPNDTTQNVWNLGIKRVET